MLLPRSSTLPLGFLVFISYLIVSLGFAGLSPFCFFLSACWDPDFGIWTSELGSVAELLHRKSRMQDVGNPMLKIRKMYPRQFENIFVSHSLSRSGFL